MGLFLFLFLLVIPAFLYMAWCEYLEYQKRKLEIFRPLTGYERISLSRVIDIAEQHTDDKQLIEDARSAIDHT